MRIICFGDSLTAGLDLKQGTLWTDLLEQESQNSYCNCGIPGDTTGGMLARFDRDVVHNDGKLVILMGGGNDFIMGASVETVQSNIMALVHQTYFCRKVPVIGIPMEFDLGSLRSDWKDFADFKKVNEKMCRYREWIYRFSKTFHTDILDFQKAFAGVRKYGYESYFSDGVHPNEKGNRLMADLILGLGM